MPASNSLRWIAILAAVVVIGGAYAAVRARSSSTAAVVPVSGEVVPFTAGQPGITQVVGRIPADYTQGSGTIVTGPAADAATATASAAFPGGSADRVVLLASGNYEVHMIAVNWPHHVFVNPSFQAIGAD